MKTALKQKLLSFEFVVDNEYLDQYCDLIIENKANKPIKSETNDHHIIPKHYFLKQHQVVDNTEDNIVTLYAIDHILAHWLLANCSSNEYYFYANMSAVMFTSAKYNLLPEEFLFSEDAKAKYVEDYANMCTILSKKYTGNGNPNYGSGTNHGGCFRGTHSEHTRALISNALKGRTSNRKGCEVSQEQRKKLSYALKLYFSDPENLLKQSERVKQSWETRRLNGTAYTTNGMHHYTNGTELVYSKVCPEGYFPGIPDHLREQRRHAANDYFAQETAEHKQARVEKAKQTIENQTEERKTEIRAKISKGVSEARANMDPEKVEAMVEHQRESLKKHHANMTAEDRDLLNKKISDSHKGKRLYRDSKTNTRKLFIPGEQPENWCLIEYDWYLDTFTGKRTRLERNKTHEDRYVKIKKE